MSIGLPIPPLGRRQPAPSAGGDDAHVTPCDRSARLGMEKLENLARALGADARNLLQAGFADVLLAQLAVRADHEAMRLVAQPLDEVEHGVARLELDRLAARDEQRFPARIAIGPLGDREQRDLRQAELIEDL